MGILNRSSDGLFNVLIVVYGTLYRSRKSLSKEELEDKCTPGIIDKNQLGNTIKRWTQLGLFVEKDNHYSISEQHKNKIDKDWYAAKKNLPKILREILFDKNNNKAGAFWGSENNLAADFTRGLSWLLAQDVYTFGAQNFNVVQQLEIRQISSDCSVLQNDTRWAGLRSWAVYLGFGWESKAFVIDPTIAIRGTLDEVFGNAEEMPISSFLEALNSILPVLDGGKYRKMVEEKLDTAVWKKPDDKWLSTSLSRALKRLEISKHIKLERRADTQEVRLLAGHDDKQWDEPLSHVIKAGRVA